MMYQPPRGTRDLLPLDVTQKSWIEAGLSQVFEAWGYHPIITSTLERLDTLMAGGAIDRGAVLQVLPSEDGDLGLRPEVTASIARAAVTRLASASYPLRLYYTANVFRQIQQGGRNQPQEFYQTGVELLGSEDLLADAEILLLITDCLAKLGLLPKTQQDPQERGMPWCLILGEASLTHALLDPFPAEVRSPVIEAIATLDRIALEELELSPELRQRALAILDLRGDPDTVLDKVGQFDLPASQQGRVKDLQRILDLYRSGLSQRFPQIKTQVPVVLDLSLVQTFDYYTGLIFEVVHQSEAGQWVLGQGGRYDQLLGIYHPQGKSQPGLGFCLNVEPLQQVLLALGQLPNLTPSSQWLVVAYTEQAQPEALAYAQKLRESSELVRVELYLEAVADPAIVREFAHDRRIPRIAWIRPGSLPEIEVLR
jgi:ATP phosphoribosyltransferase regulatory subunit